AEDVGSAVPPELDGDTPVVSQPVRHARTTRSRTTRRERRETIAGSTTPVRAKSNVTACRESAREVFPLRRPCRHRRRLRRPFPCPCLCPCPLRRPLRHRPT